jgi:hypothetical protein
MYDHLLEKANEGDHDDGGEHAEREGLEEGAEVEDHGEQHEGGHQAGQQRPAHQHRTYWALLPFSFTIFKRWVFLEGSAVIISNGCQIPSPELQDNSLMCASNERTHLPVLQDVLTVFIRGPLSARQCLS